MEKERHKPPRPKHRISVAPELPPPPEAPQLTDFVEEIVPEPEQNAPEPVVEANEEESKENRNDSVQEEK
jgi:hypothetical protein